MHAALQWKLRWCCRSRSAVAAVAALLDDERFSGAEVVAVILNYS